MDASRKPTRASRTSWTSTTRDAPPRAQLDPAGPGRNPTLLVAQRARAPETDTTGSRGWRVSADGPSQITAVRRYRICASCGSVQQGNRLDHEDRQDLARAVVLIRRAVDGEPIEDVECEPTTTPGLYLRRQDDEGRGGHGPDLTASSWSAEPGCSSAITASSTSRHTTSPTGSRRPASTSLCPELSCSPQHTAPTSAAPSTGRSARHGPVGASSPGRTGARWRDPPHESKRRARPGEPPPLANPCAS